MPTLPDTPPAAVAATAHHPARAFGRRLLGVLLALFILALCFPTVNRTHWRPAEEAIRAVTPPDRVEIYDLQNSVRRRDLSRTVANREQVAAAWRDVRDAPGAWKPGRFKEPEGYLFFVFLQRKMAPPRNDPQLLLRLTPGFLVYGGGAHWEYKHIDPAIEARIAGLGLGAAEPGPDLIPGRPASDAL
jgi:hypothetical protein